MSKLAQDVAYCFELFVISSQVSLVVKNLVKIAFCTNMMSWLFSISIVI